ncbi:MAG: hypothetical protein HY802_02960 [Methanobacterium sp.]|nr:hypothetical protein [Methanobacterium sp.]
MKRSNIMRIGIFGTLILIILASGCISSPTADTKTFSDGFMSFNYPVDFDNASYSVDNNSSSSMQLIGKLENTAPLRGRDIFVAKNISAISPTEARDRVVSVVKNTSKGEVVSITSEINPNGVVVEKVIHTEEIKLGIRARYSEMFFKIKDSVYRIMIYGDDTIDKQRS